jgi:hypothetical protein
MLVLAQVLLLLAVLYLFVRGAYSEPFLAHGRNFPCGLVLFLCLLHAYGVKFVAEFLAKQQIKKQFGTYLSPAMVEKLQKNPELLTLGGEVKRVVNHVH